MSTSSIKILLPDAGESLDNLAPVPSSVSEALRALQVEHAAVLAQNAELRALLAAEMEYSAKLVRYQQKHHESEGRTNPEKGNLDSAFYRDLKDEKGNSLIPPGITVLDTTVMLPPNELMNGERVGDKDGGKKAEISGDEMKEMEMREKAEKDADEINWKIQYARSFQSQRA